MSALLTALPCVEIVSCFHRDLNPRPVRWYLTVDYIISPILLTSNSVSLGPIGPSVQAREAKNVKTRMRAHGAYHASAQMPLPPSAWDTYSRGLSSLCVRWLGILPRIRFLQGYTRLVALVTCHRSPTTGTIVFTPNPRIENENIAVLVPDTKILLPTDRRALTHRHKNRPDYIFFQRISRGNLLPIKAQR